MFSKKHPTASADPKAAVQAAAPAVPTTAPGNPITIRPMVLEDLEQVVALDQMSFSLPWPAHSFRYELLENEVARLWVAEMDSAIVGMIVAWLIMDEVHIATIAVHPQYRRQGIGRQILLTALRECVSQGAVSATLEVRQNNSNAIDMYHKLGFEIVGRRKRYYKDTNEDAILMTLVMDKSETKTSQNGGDREAR